MDMSVDRWAWTEECEMEICCGECDLCCHRPDDEYEEEEDDDA